MKRFFAAVLIAGAAVAGTILLRPSALVGQPSAAKNSAPACYEDCCKEKDCCKDKTCCIKKKTEAEVVAELVAILDQTKSTDTFLATLLALSQFEDKSPLPAVVRNSARLGLLKGLAKEENPTHVQEMIGAFLSGEMAANARVSADVKLGNRPMANPVGYYAYPPMPAPPMMPMMGLSTTPCLPVSPACGSTNSIPQCAPTNVCPASEKIGPPRPVAPTPSASPVSEAPKTGSVPAALDFGFPIVKEQVGRPAKMDLTFSKY